MKGKRTFISAEAWRRRTAILLCACVLVVPVAKAQKDDSQPQAAGSVTGLDGTAIRNQLPVEKNASVYWNDHLKTHRDARLRIRLRDGTILNFGAQTESKLAMKAVQEISVELLNGAVRSYIPKGGEDQPDFQLNTPHSRVSIVPTDFVTEFYVDVTPARTEVIVYSGAVSVGGTRSPLSKNAAAGQTVQINAESISALQLTPEDMEQASIAQTALSDEIQRSRKGQTAAARQPSASAGGSNGRRNVLIGMGVAAAVAVALAAFRSGSQKSTEPDSIPAR